MTPMTTLPSVSFAAAAPPPPIGVAVPQAAATKSVTNASASQREIRMPSSFLSLDAELDAEMVQQLRFAGLHLVVPETGDDLALPEQIVAVRDRDREVQVLLHEQDREPVALRFLQERRDLLDEDRGEAFGRLVEQQYARPHPQHPRGR